ncbi:MAG: SufD family Fe-S cluster assembly protein [Gammaproteobacteria bacterium]|nr:MAG: SufD family Fe-S cluster assembly protein [Gammaproteobacteria bacterium]UTW43286.1 SufD family Fe-S cluster assembly protein [bacterium SCSIO 12844]
MAADILNQKPTSKDSEKNQLKTTEAYNLPTRHSERWKYTDLSRLLANLPFKAVTDGMFELIDEKEIEAQLLEHPNRLVFIDGMFSEKYSQYDHAIMLKLARVSDFKSIDYQIHPMVEQIQKNNENITSVSINKTQDTPFIIFHVFSNRSQRKWVEAQLTISVAEQCNVEIHEKCILLHQKDVVLNGLTLLNLAQASSVVYTSDQAVDHKSLFAINGLHVYQCRDSQFRYNNIALEASLLREDIHIHLNEEGANCNLAGVAFLKDHSHIDYHIIVEHSASYTTSNVDFKAAAANKSIFVCNPKAIVHSDIKGISAHQNLGNLLFDTTAAIDTKPELEIYSDDVQCTHGATIGQLDEKALFYMQSRGISESCAKELLTEAFLNIVIDDFYCTNKAQQKQLMIRKISDYYKA